MTNTTFEQLDKALETTPKHPESSSKVRNCVPVDRGANTEDISDAVRYALNIKEKKMFTQLSDYPQRETKFQSKSKILTEIQKINQEFRRDWLEQPRKNKWQFEAPDFTLIDFNKIAKDLSGEHPIIFVDYGKTEKYVVVSTRLINKSLELEYSMPPCSAVELQRGFSCLIVDSQFSDWISWAKRVKSASWPATDRKSNTVVVSTPQI